MAAEQVCEAPGARFNPLYIYGNVGTGKTHLVEGIYRKLRRHFPSLRVTYLTAEAFANYFTQALREHTLPAFRQKFRNVDVLLVDDVDFFNGKRVIQEEFLHTFKQLESHGRQIVLTSDRHPRLLTKLNEELTTRFVSGLLCRVETPELETRKRIVQRKARRLEAEISPEALQFIAERFRSNVRELEGALNCLQTYFFMTKKRVGVTAARKVLADLERDCVRVVRLADIEQAVCLLFGINSSDLKSSKRSRTVSQPRMLAMYLARKHTRAAYSEIGEYFGGRNHSTVMSAEKTVQQWLTERRPITVSAQTWSFDEVLESLEQQLFVG
jgi:chromosomal replication initiator protein